MKTIELNGFEELSSREMNDANGGLLLEILVAYYLYEHWGEVKKGFTDAMK